MWSGMIQRCTNPKLDSWKYYGAKGVKVCDRWLNSFENFSADMGCCPPDMTLERIDGNKDYEPSNCKWDTVEAQANNRSNNRRIAFGGKIQTLAQWSKITGIDRKTISDRIEAGYPMQTALWAIPGTLST